MTQTNTSCRRRICMVATIPYALNAFMAPHIRTLSKENNITLVTTGRAEDMNSLMSDHVCFFPVRIERKISLLNDMAALYNLWRLFRRERFDVVHSIAPKSGLLAMTAAKLAGVPVRIHTFTGQVWATRRGLGRLLLRSLDQLLAACATNLLADSHSQRDFLLMEKITQPNKITVLAQGSICGVDPERFIPDPVRRQAIRNMHGIPLEATVALYLGRLNREKGIPELAAAFASTSAQCMGLHLLVVGPDEGGMKELMISTAGDAAQRLHFVGFSSEPEAYMAAADFFVLPSHREGFGSTVIESAACGIPSIGNRVYGLTDAIVDDQTGLLVPAGDTDALTKAMVKLATDVNFRLKLGEQAMGRVLRDFQMKCLTDALTEYYETLFRTCRVRLAARPQIVSSRTSQKRI